MTDEQDTDGAGRGGAAPGPSGSTSEWSASVALVGRSCRTAYVADDGAIGEDPL
ncbi:MAG: hypothetical protein M5U19_17805 [Microthrixaceae bacterium]|nr:hypothetical protein [Microthrixaceae bacterium]